MTDLGAFFDAYLAELEDDPPPRVVRAHPVEPEVPPPGPAPGIVEFLETYVASLEADSEPMNRKDTEMQGINTRWIEADVDRVRVLAAEGRSAGQIGAELGKSRNTVIGICHRRKIALGVGRIGRRTRIDGSTFGTIEKLAGTGLTSQQIADRLGLTKHAVIRSCKDAGVRFTDLKVVAKTKAVAEIKKALSSESSKPFNRRSTTIAVLEEVRRSKALTHAEKEKIRADLFRPTASARPVVAASGCRWPLWSENARLEEKLVCGHSKSQTGSYCELHAALAYQSPEDRRVA